MGEKVYEIMDTFGDILLYTKGETSSEDIARFLIAFILKLVAYFGYSYETAMRMLQKYINMKKRERI